MSRFLKNKKKIGIIMIWLSAMLVLSIVGVRWEILLGIVIVCMAATTLNEVVYRKMLRMRDPFANNSPIRNVEYLVIGDFCNVKKYIPEGKSYVQISAPDRGYYSSWQILRHTHSILKEGGTVIMAIGNSKKDFMLFDIPFLHRITIDKYGLGAFNRKCRFPLVFAPIASLKFSLGGGGIL